MDVAEIPTDSSMISVQSGHDSAVGVSSVGSYSDHSVGTSSLHVAPQSPQRSTQGSVVSSPGSVHQSTVPMDGTPTCHRTPEPMPQFGVTASQFGGNDYLSGVPQREQAVPMQHHGQYTPAQQHAYPTTRQRSGNQGFTSSDDDQTDPTSSSTGQAGDNPAGYTRSDTAATSRFGKLIQTTRRRLSTGDKKRSASGDEDDILEGALIYGYLQKLGRNGKWQTRWFETDGECLTYYKSKQRLKLLATLDLAKVGSIVCNQEDPDGLCFTINISERPYHLRAESKAACKDWVITLNRVKEARMQEGNIKVLTPQANQPPDLLDHSFTPRVVVVANRQRTRAVDDEEIHSWEAGQWSENPANEGNYVTPASGRLARWQKPRNSLSRFASQLLRWARSIRNYGCTDAENHVILDHHVHPPGHDDKPKRSSNGSPSSRDAQESLPGDRVGVPSASMDADSVAPSVEQEEEELETRELA